MKVVNHRIVISALSCCIVCHSLIISHWDDCNQHVLYIRVVSMIEFLFIWWFLFNPVVMWCTPILGTFQVVCKAVLTFNLNLQDRLSPASVRVQGEGTGVWPSASTNHWWEMDDGQTQTSSTLTPRLRPSVPPALPPPNTARTVGTLRGWGVS